MRKLVLDVEDLHFSAAFNDANPEAFGVWVRLCMYCARHMTGGTIEDCRRWDERSWDRACSVTPMAIGRAQECGLIEWRGSTLVVVGYPKEQESAYRSKSKGAEVARSKRLSKSLSHKVDSDIRTDINSDIRTDITSLLFSSLPEGEIQEREIRQGGSQDPFQALPKSTTTHPVPPAPPRTFSDFLAMHPRCFVSREDRGDWEALFRLAGWDDLSTVYVAVAAQNPPPKRIFRSLMADYIEQHYDIRSNHGTGA